MRERADLRCSSRSAGATVEPKPFVRRENANALKPGDAPGGLRTVYCSLRSGGVGLPKANRRTLGAWRRVSDSLASLLDGVGPILDAARSPVRRRANAVPASRRGARVCIRRLLRAAAAAARGQRRQCRFVVAG